MSENSSKSRRRARSNDVAAASSQRDRTAEQLSHATHAPGQQDDVASGSRIDVGHATVEHIESLASLLRRLGSPPNDLSRDLRANFREVCQAELHSGRRIDRIDLNRWFIDTRGRMSYRGADFAQASGASKTLNQLTDEFSRRLVTEEAMPSRERTVPERFDRSHAKNIPAVTTGSDGVPVQAETQAEQERHDRLARLLTSALIDRFGEECVRDTAPVSPPISLGKLQPVERDRRFNWNVVLAVGSVAAVIGMIFTGVKISQNHEQRRSNVPRATLDTDIASTVRSGDLSVDAVPDQHDAGQILSPSETNSSEDSSVANDVAVVFAPNSVFAKQNTSAPIEDMVDMLSGVVEDAASGEPSPPESEINSLDDLIEMLPNRPTEDGDRPDADTVDEASTEIDPKALRAVGQAESNQHTTSLPAIGKTEFVSLGVPATIDFSNIDSLDNRPFRLLDGAEKGTKSVVERESGTTIALLQRGANTWRFRWTEHATSAGQMTALANSRLLANDDQVCYLRRGQIMESPPTVPIGSRPNKFTWDLGTRVPEKAVRLELGLRTPESFSVTWNNEFNRYRPTLENAVAVIAENGKDSKPVQVQVRLDVLDDSRELAIRSQWWVRLDPALTWLSPPQFVLLSHQVPRQQILIEEHLENIREQTTRGSDTERERARRRRDQLKASLEQFQEASERIEFAEALLLEIETRAQLKFDLSVEWNDGAKQLILKTSD